MTLNRETVILALEGVLLTLNPVLWEHSGSPTTEHNTAIKSVHANLNLFRKIVQDELNEFPTTKRLLGHLIGERALQDSPLASPIIGSLFSFSANELENRLNRILHIPNIETVSSTAHAPKDLIKGGETDEIVRDVWTEFFVADFLVNTLQVQYIEKVIRGKSQVAVEFCVRHNDEEWAVEVARLRKRDFQGETMPWGSLNCTRPENVTEIQKALRLKLFDKNKQIQKFIGQEKRDFDRRVVVIKTSQEEYQECKKIITKEAKRLMNERAYPEITHLLLIYDTETYEFVENLQAR